MQPQHLVWIAECSATRPEQRNLETLGPRYLQQVLGHMQPDDTVAFGQTGTGQTPNYQIARGPDAQQAFRGQNHQRYDSTDTFCETNLSAPFTYAQILRIYCQLRDASSSNRPTRGRR